jgi:hypothetical protein
MSWNEGLQRPSTGKAWEAELGSSKRDCLVHFSLTHIAQALDNLKKSDIKYILTTTFPHIEHNEDIQTGYWRPINLEKAPFFFPKPLFLLQEAGSGAQGSYAHKSLGLWEIDSLDA